VLAACLEATVRWWVLVSGCLCDEEIGGGVGSGVTRIVNHSITRSWAGHLLMLTSLHRCDL
jgi:hypothetical protein